MSSPSGARPSEMFTTSAPLFTAYARAAITSPSGQLLSHTRIGISRSSAGHTGHTLAVDRRRRHTAHHRPVLPEIVGPHVAVSEVPPMDVSEAIAVVVHPVARHLARVVPEPRR